MGLHLCIHYIDVFNNLQNNNQSFLSSLSLEKFITGTSGELSVTLKLNIRNANHAL